MAIWFYRATIPDVHVKAWEAEVAALAVRKRRNWKQRTSDAQGCLCAVRYVPSGHDLGFGHVTYFELRVSDKAAAESGLPPGSRIPLQSVAQRAEVYAAASRATGGRALAVDLDTRTTYVPTPDVAEYAARVASKVASNSTGNHQPHRHRVSVPTRAGEPVRG